MRYEDFVSRLDKREVKYVKTKITNTLVTPQLTLRVNGVEYPFDKKYSLGQFCQRINFPASHVDRFLDVIGQTETVDLLNRFLNHGQDQDVFILLFDNEISAVRSSRFASVMNDQLIRIIEEQFDDRIEPFKHVFEYSGQTRWGYYFPDYRVKINERDHIYPGFSVRNSEIGMGSVGIDFMFFREICSNGVIAKLASSNVFKEIHVGSKTRLLLEFGNALKKIQRAVEPITDLVKEHGYIKIDIDAAIDYLITYASLSKKVGSIIKSAYDEEPLGEDLFALSAALSRVSTHNKELSEPIRNVLGELAGAVLLDKKIMRVVAVE